MDPLLAEAIAPILRDMRTSWLPVPRFTDEAWDEPPMLSVRVGWPHGYSGVNIDPRDSLTARILRVTEMLQEQLIEEIGATGRSNWPVCPPHPRTHPMQPEIRAGSVCWTCPADRSLIAAVGAL